MVTVPTLFFSASSVKLFFAGFGNIENKCSNALFSAVPTMISSFWGMNVQIPFKNSPFGFVIMIFISVVLTLLVTWILKKKDMLN